MKFVKRLLLVCLCIIVVLAGIGLILPQHVKAEHPIIIDAPALEIYSLTNDFQPYNKWSPWAQEDTNTQYRYEGPGSGVGAKIYWVSPI